MSQLEIEIVTDGLAFPEGPVWMRDGSVLVVEVAGGRIIRVRPNGEKQVAAEPGGGPNGAAIGPDGKLYVCNNGLSLRDLEDRPTRRLVSDYQRGTLHPDGPAKMSRDEGRIERIDLETGQVERLYTECDGRPLGAPNDLVFDDDGGFWFTDRGHTHKTGRSHGGLFYARADGSAIIRAVDRIRPNGIGLSPDGKTIYAALTDERQIIAFDKLAPGKVAPIGNYVCGRLVAALPGRQLLDSLAIMAGGAIAQAVIWDEPGIAIVDPATGAVERIGFPDRFTTNICFGGPDMRDAWVTLSETGRLAKVRWPTPGLRLNYYA